jgi:hypothetical protein
MYCPSCGKSIKQENNFCTYCGEETSAQIASNKQSEIDTFSCPKARMISVFGILGLFFSLSVCWILGSFSIPALIMSMGELKKYPDDQRLSAAKIMSIAGVIIMILGAISFVVLKSKIRFPLR